ncbi:hypothetical protein HPP92_020342 [Vanilla planifolia]|uniref:Uncharacterized protein n=1 Tax=Vanilla planifolia TaxID=51239 RepID=A0A835UK04_VANPL|nr:hypothetical protein HPP92_020342 [Vanilla planifolia]
MVKVTKEGIVTSFIFRVDFIFRSGLNSGDNQMMDMMTEKWRAIYDVDFAKEERKAHVNSCKHS